MENPTNSIKYDEPMLSSSPLPIEDVYGNYPQVNTPPKWLPKTFAVVNITPTTGAVTIDPTLGSVFKIVATGGVQPTPSSFPAGGVMTIIIVTSGTTGYTFSFQTGFVANGTLTTANLDSRWYSITFACDGVKWIELSRLGPMLPS